MALKQKLAELVVDIKARLEPLKKGLAKARGVMKRGLDKMVRMARRAAIGIGVALVAAFAWATRAAMVQEDAERELAAALGQTGDAVKENIDGLKAYAAELQQVTIYGDEQILSQMAYAKNLGVSTGQLKEAAKAAIGLAAKYKLELATAMMLVGRASQGQTQMLTRYGIVLDDSLSSQEKFSAVLKIGAGAFGLAEDAAKGTRGTLRQLWNTIGDVAERIAGPLLPRIKEVAVAIGNWLKANQDLIASRFGQWVDVSADVLTHLIAPLKWLSKHTRVATIALIAFAAILLRPAILFAARGVGWLAKGLWGLGKAIVYTITMLSFLGKMAVLNMGKYNAILHLMPKASRRMFDAVKTLQFALWKLQLRIQGFPWTLKLFAGKWRTYFLFPVASATRLLKYFRGVAAKALILPVAGISKVGVALKALIVAIKGITLAGMATAAAFVAILAGIVVGIVFIVKQLSQWAKALFTIWKHREQLRKQMTFEERAAKARETREERELKRKKRLLTIEEKRIKASKSAKEKEEAAAKARAATMTAEDAADKDRLEAQLAFLEKVGDKTRDAAKIKRALLAIEAKEVAEKTGGDPTAIRLGLTRKELALQKAADKEADEERRSEYRDSLQVLKELFTGESRYAKDLAAIKKRLRHEEAIDVQKAAPWLDLEAIKSMLKAKEAPVEIARAGLVGIQAAWGQIATGTQRTQEEQLRALVGIRESVERQEEIAEAGRGMSNIGTPRR